MRGFDHVLVIRQGKTAARISSTAQAIATPGAKPHFAIAMGNVDRVRAALHPNRVFVRTRALVELQA